jgi:hypothetical protein
MVVSDSTTRAGLVAQLITAVTTISRSTRAHRSLVVALLFTVFYKEIQFAMMIFKLIVYAAMVGSVAVILFDVFRLLKRTEDDR